ncbi:MAG TPA: CbiX/SirB N-terminal domain-containing protein [Burkholderiaceae bacterium]|nr:CbiX/SirB N-terminal domain-containing protein [Burkholderiaceae bacterium]
MSGAGRGLVLFAHGARDPRWAAPFDAIAAAVRARAPEVQVRLAFLELMAPDLGTAVDALVAEGCTAIDVLPLFLGTGGHLRRDLPPLVEAAAARHAGVTIALHGAAGEAPAMIAALAEHAVALTRT